tara:strand:- start:3663 stop:4037 length:375 start_codon:yes stop_codon:yes gene_type:complete
LLKQFLRFQANSILSVTLRSTAIYLFTDIFSYEYSLVFWISFVVVTTNSYFIQKKYVFKTSSKQSFLKYNFVTFSLSFIEFFFSNFLRIYFELNVYAFLIAGGTVFIMRFLLNKYFVFGSKNEK